MNKKGKILVVGSSNTDLVIQTDHLPVPGETILGGNFFMSHGGKGANQAVAVAKLGGDTAFVGKIGTDLFGKQSCELFNKYGIDTTYLYKDEQTPSGVALITVDKNAENCIAVASGANMKLTPADLKHSMSAIDEAEVILVQLEIPMDTVEYVVKAGKEKHKKVVLNPAPAQKLSEELLNGLYLITPNETEAELLTGRKVTDVVSAEKAAQIFLEKGVENVIITLGSKGSCLYNKKESLFIPAFKVKAVDTTAAGDVYNGALCVRIAEKAEWKDAIVFANKAAAISVTRAGAQASVPTRKEVEEFKL
ncbi:MAG: ribokinase [Phocaeicola sp.]|uniref:ribokinase n=1 Tax=Phocaeicola sp. TaxID=2773926 RepID=UPI003FA10F55